MMLKHVLFLLFVCGIKNGGSSTSQEQTIESKDISKNGIKKNEVGANGLENNFEKITRNFQNPVLAYLLQRNSDRTNGQLPPQKGVVREIRHSQTLLLPNFLGSPLPEFLINHLPQFQAVKAPGEQNNGNPDGSPFENFWNFLKNKTRPGENKIQESVVFSPVLHLNKSPDEVKEESTSVQTYPAVAVVINTFNRDGSLKNSVTHFQPDFKSLRPEPNEKEATHEADGKSIDKNYKNIYNSQYTVNNFIKGSPNSLPGGFDQQQVHRQGISWPFANYFPIVINDPFLSVYYALTASMYNAVTSMIEYGPEADICLREKGHKVESNLPKSEKVNCEVVNRDQKQSRLNDEDIPVSLSCNEKEAADDKANTFDEVTMESESFRNNYGQLLMKVKQNPRGSSNSFGRERRDTTSIFVKSREGDRVDVTLEEPTGSNSGHKISEGSDLIIRKGGVAIAGPGGAATAYTGGTAIVGPYGTVYKSPEGVAILGPFSKVVNISDETSFEEILRMHKNMQSHSQQSHVANQQGGGVGFKTFRHYFSYLTSLPVKFEVKPQARSFIKHRPKIFKLKEDNVVKAIEEIKKAEFRRIVQDTPFEQRVAKGNETTLVFRPKSKAEAGKNGVALSAPTSHAVLYPGQKTSIYFEPESVASAGPSGFAHAHSDLFVTYLPNKTASVQPERRKRSFQTVLLKRLTENNETN